MFEYALAEAHGRTARPYTFMVSVAGQLGLIALAVLLPLLFKESLPQVPWIDLRVPVFAPLSKPAQLPMKTGTPVTRQVRGSGKLFEPFRYPSKPVQIVDSPVLAPEGLAHIGIPGEYGERMNPVIQDVLRPITVTLPPVHVEKPAPPPEQPVRYPVGGVVAAPKPLHTPLPAYPPLARQAGVSGLVRLEAVIGTNGSVRSIRLVQGHYMLAGAAIAAVKEWRYTPPTLNGEPIEVIMQLDVNFKLNP